LDRSNSLPMRYMQIGALIVSVPCFESVSLAQTQTPVVAPVAPAPPSAQAAPPQVAPPPAPPPPPAPAVTVTVTTPAAPATAAPAVVAVGAAPGAPAPAPAPTEEKASEPFAFADFTWLNGVSRQSKAVLDTPYFTPEVLLDVNYTQSLAHPIDDTVVGSTALSRDNELTLAFIGFGGDFHYENVRGRLMTQFGVRSTLVPRNDGSANRGQFDLETDMRYLSEAYGGYHFDVLHGINIDAGIFMSYVGLFSYDNFENWMYLASYTSDNTPWFFNGIRTQIFPSDKLKIEPWIINGWQTYGTFNEMPGFGAQVLWRPVEEVELLSNDYVGWDTQDNPGQTRWHSDNSFLLRYYKNDAIHALPMAAFSLTADIGGMQGDGAQSFGGQTGFNDPLHPAHCTVARPCNDSFASWMLYNRFWLFDGILAWNVGGGMMTNPSRYLVLAPTGQASGVAQALSLQGINYAPATQPFNYNLGTSFEAWDVETGFQYMPNLNITYDVEVNHREASVPYFAGHGGVTSPDGYIQTHIPTGWRPDLVKADNRIIFAMLVRF
jgi:hypothetical protein